jgi:hypothetical protein
VTGTVELTIGVGVPTGIIVDVPSEYVTVLLPSAFFVVAVTVFVTVGLGVTVVVVVVVGVVVTAGVTAVGAVALIPIAACSAGVSA